MSRGINKVILIGNLGKDAERRELNNGQMATFNLATSESWKDKNTGESVEKTEWHRVVLFGRIVETLTQYLKKGTRVYVEGALQTRKWQDDQGQDRYTTQIVVNVTGKLLLLDGAKPSEEQRQGSASVRAQQPKLPIDPDDDIPF